VERIARAIARTHVETGAPITVHTSGPHQTGRIAVRIFREEGVDLTKVVIGHAGDSNDLDYLTELADQGVLLGMDRFGLDLFNPGTEPVKTIIALATRGYAGQMVLADAIVVPVNTRFTDSEAAYVVTRLRGRRVPARDRGGADRHHGHGAGHLLAGHQPARRGEHDAAAAQPRRQAARAAAPGDRRLVHRRRPPLTPPPTGSAAWLRGVIVAVWSTTSRILAGHARPRS
jgi:Phosphotriesterase family